MITRRTMLTAAGAAAALPIVPAPWSAQAAAPLAGQQAPGVYRYKVGEIEITAINDGMAQRPLEGFIRNAELADVRKALDEAFMPGDKLTIPFTTLVLNTASKLVLIDTGNGDSGPATSGVWMNNFKAAGFDPAKVDTVIISHFHGDHISGLRLKDGNAVFPNAEVMVPAAEWTFWMDDGRMAQAPEAAKFAFQNVRRIFGPMAKDVTRFEAGKEIVPGVTAVAAPGHTPGHTVFAIASGADKLMALSDTTNHPALFVRHPDWQAIFDMDGNQARETRRKLLDMVAADRMQVAFYHAPFPATGHVTRDGSGYRLVPVAWSSQL